MGGWRRPDRAPVIAHAPRPDVFAPDRRRSAAPENRARRPPRLAKQGTGWPLLQPGQTISSFVSFRLTFANRAIDLGDSWPAAARGKDHREHDHKRDEHDDAHRATRSLGVSP